jgi:hypothetical protein
LNSSFYDSLRRGYPGFNSWFRRKAQEGRSAWTYRDENGQLGALCVYAVQEDETITNDGVALQGKALKLCTFKVAETCRGRKVGELFLKAAFRFATANALAHVFIHANSNDHLHLIGLLKEFGFAEIGHYTQGDVTDTVYVKEHPLAAPSSPLSPFEYHKMFYPHYRTDSDVAKFIVPIRPEYHRILFPDFISDNDRQQPLFRIQANVGNAIKLAYLCHAQTNRIRPGDIVLFYRSLDERAITSLGIVEHFQMLDDPAQIARVVSRRTVYSMRDIELLARKPTKVMLFRLAHHFSNPITYDSLERKQVVNGNIQTIRKINETSFRAIIDSGLA